MNDLQGVYLVIDPMQPQEVLIQKLHAALKGGVRIVQIWDHWNDEIEYQEKLDFIAEIRSLTHQFEVPLLMHEDWQLAMEAGMDGVHFDHIPHAFSHVKNTLSEKIIGITVGNDIALISWAEQQQLSYISFCAMFPSPSVSSCEIVDPQTVIKAREQTQLPIFLSGGIRPDNIKELSKLPFIGIAVISGILSSEDPETATMRYTEELTKLKTHEN